MGFYILQIIMLLGGLALFLFGMDVMGKALERTAGGKLQTILSKMSSNVFLAIALGTVVTAVIQSSSATTVMLVGFVNSGIMTLQQTLGVILGANIGTTVTAWILSLTSLKGDSFIIQLFKPATLAPIAAIIGIVLFMFVKDEKKKSIGTILLGFMTLMTGMQLMGDAMEFLEDKAWFTNLMLSFSNPLLGILFGTVLTALIQSSSASVGILQGLCVTGAVTFGSAIPIILGQNIGTCVTAVMGAIGANRNAQRTALMHLLFKITGVTIFVVVFYGLGLFIDWEFLTEKTSAFDIAVVHTLYNGAMFVLLPLRYPLLKLACVILPDKKEPEKTVLLDERLLETPAVAVQQAHEVAGRMAESAAEAMKLAMDLTKHFDPKVLERIKELEDMTDHYQDALGAYLLKLSNKRLSVEDNRILNTLLYSIADIERIADHAVTVGKAGKEIDDKKVNFSDQAKAELNVLMRAIADILDRTVSTYKTFDYERARKIEAREQVVDALVKEIKSRHVRRLREGMCTVEYGFVLEDMLTAFERTADHCSNVAVETMQVAEGKLEAHEYLNALKAGELQESVAFAEQFAKYKARYAFPEEQ